MKTTRVLLADDHGLVRAGFRSLLEAVPSVEVIGEAKDGAEALSLIGSLHPDVALVDIGMPQMNGFEVLTRIKEAFPQTRVIIVSMHSSEEFVVQALRAGAAGYVLKDAAVAELELAIKSVARGETYLGPSVARKAIQGYLQGTGKGKQSANVLTPRQREILRLIAEGKNTKEIAYTLNLSVKTVESHRLQLAKRLNIRDVAGLVRYAVRTGLVSDQG